MVEFIFILIQDKKITVTMIFYTYGIERIFQKHF